jgi:hypothetical protein
MRRKYMYILYWKDRPNELKSKGQGHKAREVET